MIIKIITFFLFFICFFIISFYILFSKKFYLLFPILILTFWFLISLINLKISFDSRCFYNSGLNIKNNPSNLYEKGYYYTPFFASIFALTLIHTTLINACYIFLIVNYFFGFLCILKFDKFLTLKKLNYKQKLQFFIIFNGFFIYIQFYNNQTKFILFYCLLEIIIREFQYKTELRNNKYYLVINFYWSLIIGIAPYLILLFIIYIFHNFKIKTLFKKKSLYVHFSFILIFIIENIYFLLFPFLFIDFCNGILFSKSMKKNNVYFYYIVHSELRDFISKILFINIILLILLLFSVMIIIKLKDISLEIRFGYFFLSYLLFGTFSYQFQLSIIIFSFISILLINNIQNQNKQVFLILINIVLISFFVKLLNFFSVLRHYYKYILYIPHFSIVNQCISIILFLSLFLQIIILEIKNE